LKLQKKPKENMTVDTKIFLDMVDINMVTMCLNPLLDGKNCNDKTLLNIYQALFLYGRKLNHMTEEMDKVKLDQKVATQGNGTFIQGQNVQINKGKSPMPIDYQPSFFLQRGLKQAATSKANEAPQGG
jgi:hypothetical protein